MALRWLVIVGLLQVCSSDAVVDTPLGRIAGVDEGAFLAYRGLRYVEPPARFEAAQPKRPWSGTLNASRFGDACLFDFRGHGVFGMSEDCLYANVWTPPNAKNLPVVVFIHGGGFLMGSGADPKYWGDVFVQGLPTVLVTFNYRMGILGFFSSNETGANFGFRDQQEALRWVHANIDSFGGNPNDVTLVGQSAGAMSVQAHLVAPGSRGLFHRAFMASTVGLHYRSLSENKAFVDSAAKVVGCHRSDSMLACLRSRPALVLDSAAIASGYLFQLQKPCDGCDNFLPWMPIVDGETLPNAPLSMLRSGEHARVPVVVSTVRNETLAFIPALLHGIGDIKVAYEGAMRVLFKNNSKLVEEHYAHSPDAAGMNLTTRLTLALSDALFTCYGRYVAGLLSTRSPTFLSTFMHAPSGHADPDNGAVDTSCERGATCHAADLNWMFPNSPEVRERRKLVFTAQEELLLGNYVAAFKGFAHGNMSAWSPYSRGQDESVSWGDIGPRRISGYHNDHCNFFEAIGFDWTSGHQHGHAFVEGLHDIIV